VSARGNGRKEKVPGRSFDLYAFSDEELLALVKDNLDTEGWVTSAELADAIGIPDDEDNRLNGIGIRLGWMGRYGVVRKDTEKKVPARWTITGRGIVILEATFSKSLEDQLAGLKGEALWRLSQTISARYSDADDVSAVLVRRSFQRAYHQRRFR
jgi:hypothetical protein